MQKPPGAKPSKPKGAFTLARYYCSFYVLPLLSLIFTQPQGSRILRATGTTVKSPFGVISPKYVHTHAVPKKLDLNYLIYRLYEFSTEKLKRFADARWVRSSTKRIGCSAQNSYSNANGRPGISLFKMVKTFYHITD